MEIHDVSRRLNGRTDNRLVPGWRADRIRARGQPATAKEDRRRLFSPTTPSPLPSFSGRSNTASARKLFGVEDGGGGVMFPNISVALSMTPLWFLSRTSHALVDSTRDDLDMLPPIDAEIFYNRGTPDFNESDSGLSLLFCGCRSATALYLAIS